MTAEEKENKKSISAAEYIRTTFHSSDRLAVLVRNRSRGETIQRITTSARIVEPAFQEWMHFKNEKESCDIYVGMNTLKPEARTRTKEDIQTIRHLYVDIDHDGPAALAKIQQSSLVPSPNYTVNTSPDKFQVVWRVENISPEQAEALQRAMARKFGGDPAATDSTRVLRLPGFLNRKYDTEFWVHAEKHTDRSVICTTSGSAPSLSKVISGLATIHRRQLRPSRARSASPNMTGPMRSAPSPAVTTRKS